MLSERVKAPSSMATLLVARQVWRRMDVGFGLHLIKLLRRIAERGGGKQV